MNINNKNYDGLGGHFVPQDGSVFDAWYGPWNNWKEVSKMFINVVDNEQIELSEVTQDDILYVQGSLGGGVTVGIYENGKVVGYWKPSATVPEGNTDGGFVIKSPNVEVADSAIDKAVSDYLTEHPVNGVTDEQVEDAVNKYLDENPASVTPNKDGVGLLYYLAA